MEKVDQRYAESLSRELRRAARISADEIRSALDVARAYLGRGRVMFVPPVEVLGEAELTEDRGRPMVLVSDGAPRCRAPFLVTACVAEHFLVAIGMRRSRVDVYAPRVAAATLAPASTYVRALSEHGEDVAAVAASFGLQEAAGWLRLGEVRGDGVAIVDACQVLHQRNVLPLEPATLPRLAVADIVPAGVTIARLRDQPGRSAVRAA